MTDSTTPSPEAGGLSPRTLHGDAYAAAAGSTHTDFETETGATYVVIFKL